MSDKQVLESLVNKLYWDGSYSRKLMDFGEVLRQYGVEKVMADLDEDSYWILEKWFIKGEVK